MPLLRFLVPVRQVVPGVWLVNACETCGGKVEQWYTSTGPVHVGSCSNCGATATQAAREGDPSSYAGTGHSLSELEAMHALTADDLLMEALYDARKRIAALRAIEQDAEAMLRQRILERKGKSAASASFEAKLDPTPSYSWNIETILELQNHVTPDDFDDAVPLIPAVEARRNPHKGKLNVLANRGGEVKRIIDAALIPGPTTYKVKVEQRKK